MDAQDANDGAQHAAGPAAAAAAAAAGVPVQQLAPQRNVGGRPQGGEVTPWQKKFGGSVFAELFMQFIELAARTFQNLAKRGTHLWGIGRCAVEAAARATSRGGQGYSSNPFSTEAFSKHKELWTRTQNYLDILRETSRFKHMFERVNKITNESRAMTEAERTEMVCFRAFRVRFLSRAR